MILVAGLVCIAGGLALSVLPGPLTIPPVLLGLWLWSTEFAWAQRLFQSAAVKGREAWRHARKHPVSSTTITAGGLLMVVAGVWTLQRLDVVSTVRAAVGA
ncbi:PGPGW domain-containing protein [Actinomycetospora flava]|uniref:PGPGW domain-containing protein n=1 Tax=Actinomycetospora flava TaxID=3129232 RepID=A0ABU8MAE5_9PSEU